MPLPALLAFYFLFPALVLYLCYRFPFVNKIGAVIICYVAGGVLGNTGLAPEAAASTQGFLTDLTVAAALPLLLFNMDVKAWTKLAGKAALSFAFAAVSVLVVAFFAVLAIRGAVPDAWKLGGMAVGVYTGGTPNMAAIKTALRVDDSLFIVMHTYDTVLSFIYIFFCASAARKVFGLFLRPAAAGRDGSAPGAERSEDISAYGGIFRPRRLAGLAAALAVSLLIVGAGLGVSSLTGEAYKTAAAILTITTLGIISSFISPIRKIEKTFQLGMYIIYVFCTIVASMADMSALVNVNWALLGFVALCIFGSMFLHGLLCKIGGVDVDTFIITSVSAICSPPFVPVVASRLQNKTIMLSGITTGIIGYAVGNYLGISFAYLVR
ncbi:MAG: DUF819 family protein [Treponema sp.]|jgi:uncharacterized membrane protein|nr:DUF819 family protein [Treponema sp.]